MQKKEIKERPIIREFVSMKVTLYYKEGSLDASIITPELLKDHQLIDENNNLAEGRFRAGSLGANIVFDNVSEDEIKISPTNIEIGTDSEIRFYLIMEKLALIFPDVTIFSGKLYRDIHLTDVNFPSSVFNQFRKSDEIELEVIKWKKDNFGFQMSNCKYLTLHLKTSSDFNARVQFGDLNIDSTFNVGEMLKVQDQNVLASLGIK